MKLFKETPEQQKKTFSVKVEEQFRENIVITLVDSQTGHHVAQLAEIEDDGLVVFKDAKINLIDGNYDYNPRTFDTNGSINVIRR
jgi:hypothetical protein